MWPRQSWIGVFSLLCSSYQDAMSLVLCATRFIAFTAYSQLSNDWWTLWLLAGSSEAAYWCATGLWRFNEWLRNARHIYQELHTERYLFRILTEKHLYEFWCRNIFIKNIDKHVDPEYLYKTYWSIVLTQKRIDTETYLSRILINISQILIQKHVEPEYWYRNTQTWYAVVSHHSFLLCYQIFLKVL